MEDNLTNVKQITICEIGDPVLEVVYERRDIKVWIPSKEKNPWSMKSDLMRMNINIRKAIAEDYSALIGLFDEIDSIHRDELPHLFQKPKGPVRNLDYFSGLISDESTAIFVAEIDGNVVGLVHAIVRETPNIPVLVPRRFAIVDSIVVKTEYKRRGIGGMLMETIEEWSKKKGASSIELNVYEFNEEAVTFYENLGLKTFSRRLSKELE